MFDVLSLGLPFISFVVLADFGTGIVLLFDVTLNRCYNFLYDYAFERIERSPKEVIIRKNRISYVENGDRFAK